MTTPQQRALDILEAGLGLDDAGRARLYAEADAADPLVGAELRRLESARTRAPRFLPTDPGARGAATEPERSPPERIGVFRLGRLVGAGGMGRVHEALREDGLFEQRVAIKLLSGHRWTGELERRFTSERRILASLEHRNIARIYDGGLTAEGWSYIVMEFVNGPPITEFAQRQALDIEARVRLFGQLCAALQFAHQQLVVHADVKPSNVLVTSDGSVKLLDFGIAQLIELGRRHDDGPASSLPSPMTTAYAAPERTAGGGPTVAGDVYSLGIVLRELIEACAPRENAPPDLLAIQSRATAADPASRYGSVRELWDDLGDWLRQMPVRAFGGGWRYRARKFTARNSALVGVASVTLVGLTLASIVSTAMYLRAERAREAELARFTEARDLNAALIEDLSAQMSHRPGAIDANWPALTSALHRLEALARDRPNDAGLQIDVARSTARIAENIVQGTRPAGTDGRRVREALDAATLRLDALEVSARSRADFWSVRAELATQQAAVALLLEGDTRLAETRAREALQMLDRAAQANATSAALRTTRITAETVTAAVLNGAGKPKDAIATIDRVLESEAARPPALREELAAWPLRQRIAVLEAQFLRCDFKRWSASDAESLRDCETTVQQLRAALAERGQLVTLESRLAYALFLVATQLPRSEDARALQLLDEARAIYGRILHFGSNEQIGGYVLVVEAARANVLAQLGRITEARDSAAALLRARRARFAAEPGHHARRREVATALRRVGEIELMDGRIGAACRAFAEAGAIWDAMEREGRLLGFDLALPSGQVPWIRAQLQRCPPERRSS